jgi:hypothetical protein
MVAEYSVWLLHHAQGYPLDLVEEFQSLDYVKNTNGVGAFTMTLPASFDLSIVQEDTRVAVMRKPVGGSRTLDFCGFVRKIGKSQRGSAEYWTLYGYDLNYLLSGRVVAYAAGTAQASKSDQADDMIKAIVRENLGALCADTTRNLTSYGLTVQADAGLGTAIVKEFSWRNVLDVLKEIADASHTTEATSAYFGIVPLNYGWECEFRTNIFQWGVDHRFPGGSAGAVMFSLELANIKDVDRVKSWETETTYAYAGGQGEGAARVIGTSSDATRLGASPFNRRELFIDARNETDATGAQNAADSAVRNGRPLGTFNGQLVSIGGGYVYGRDYAHGDYVTAVYRGETIDCRIDTTHININAGVETIEIGLRSEA